MSPAVCSFSNAAVMLSELRIAVSHGAQTPWTIILTKGLTLIKHNIIQDLAKALTKKKQETKSLGFLGRPAKLKNVISFRRWDLFYELV